MNQVFLSLKSFQKSRRRDAYELQSHLSLTSPCGDKESGEQVQQRLVQTTNTKCNTWLPWLSRINLLS